MKISALLLSTLAAASTRSAIASVDHRLVAQIAEQPLQNLRGLKKKDGGDADVTTPEDATVEEPAEDTADVPTEDQDEPEDDAGDEDQEDEAADEEDEGEADVEPVEVVEEPAGDEGVSPVVWYSVGGVVAAIVAYFACCKKGDDGYSRIQ